jgi:hypothetical protein
MTMKVINNEFTFDLDSFGNVFDNFDMIYGQTFIPRIITLISDKKHKDIDNFIDDLTFVRQ